MKEKISRNVILLGIVSFLTDISSEIIFPILPMFIASLGGAGLIIGLIGGLSDSVSAILKVVSGYWSDRIGKRKPFVFFGYGLSSFSKILLSFSTTWHYAVVLVSLERVGKGLRDAPRDAILAQSSENHRGRAFGFHRAMDTTGAIIGSALSFVLFYYIGLSFGTIIFAAGIIGFFSLIPVSFVKEKDNPPVKTSLKLSLKALPGDFRMFVAIASIFALGNFTYMFFILKAQGAFSDPKMAVALPLLLYVWFNIVYAAFSMPVGNLSDRIGRKKILIAGYGLFTLTCVGFAFSNSLVTFIIFFALYGVAYSLIDATQRAFASDLIPENIRGTGLGTFHTAIGLAALPASLIAGGLWEYDPTGGLTFIYGAAMGLVATAMFVFYSNRLTC